MFNVVDSTEVAMLAMHHMQISEFANVGAGSVQALVVGSKTPRSSK